MFGVMQWLRSCDFNSSDSWKNEECTKGVDEVLKQYNEIDIYSLLLFIQDCFCSSPSGFFGIKCKGLCFFLLFCMSFFCEFF